MHIFEAVAPFLSVTVSVNANVPAFEAVPEIVAFVPEDLSFNPDGKLPLLTFHV